MEEVKENSKSPSPAPSGTSRVSPAHPTPGTPTYLTNGSDHLPNPRYPRVLLSSSLVLSPEPPAAPKSSPPAAPVTSLRMTAALSFTSTQKRRMRRDCGLSPLQCRLQPLSPLQCRLQPLTRVERWLQTLTRVERWF